MVRFKVAIPGRAPEDEAAERLFALEVDGVDVLGGAGEEPSGRVLPELLETLGALHQGKSRCGQLSLPDSQLELCFFRLDDRDVELSVVRSSRPVQRLGKALVLELSALVDAARDCAQQWKEHVESGGEKARPRKGALAQKLKLLEGPAAPLRAPARGPFEFQRSAEPGLALHVADALGRRFAWDKRSRAHLPPLLFEGAVTFAGRSANDHQPVFLTLLELTRTAAGQEAAPPELAAGGEPLRRALFEAALDFGAALVTEHPPLAKNPYLEVLIERCHLGLAALFPTSAAKAPAPRTRARKSPAPGADLAAGLALRRLRFEPEWEKPSEWGDGPARILLSPKGPTVAGGHVALGFGPRGEIRFRRMGTHGVAASSEGKVLTASAGRMLCFTDAAGSASWLKDHDGTLLGPELICAPGQLVCRWGSRGVASFCAVTGRELWRVDPPRARVTGFSVEGERALLPTDSGLLVAVQLSDGVPNFRMRATSPMPHRMVRAQRRYLGVLSQGTSAALFSVDLDAAAIGWTRELALAQPSEPLPHKGRIYIAGEREGRAVLVLLDGRGVVLWEKQLPLEGGRYALCAAGPGVLVQDAVGSAALVVRDGEIEWRVGASSSSAAVPIAPQVVRGVVVLPGDTTRVVEVRSGRLLAEVPTRGLVDLKVDKKLKLYALEESGVLKVLRLSAQLALA